MPHARRYYKKRRPYRSKAAAAKKAYVSKRRYRYKRTRYQKLTKQVARNQIVSDRFFTTLKYQVRPYSVTLNATTAVNGSIILRGNSLYDPEYSVGGGQPIGYDNIKTLYQFYKVHACKITARVFNHSSTNNGGTTYLTILPTVNPSSPNITQTQHSMISGQPHSRYRLCGAGINTNSKDRMLSHKMLSKVVLGTKSLREVFYETNIASDPTSAASANKAWFWIVTLWNADVNTTTITYQVDITMQFMCEFMRPVNVIDYSLYGDPDGVNDTPQAYSGTQLTYQPVFGGSGTNAVWET